MGNERSASREEEKTKPAGERKQEKGHAQQSPDKAPPWIWAIAVVGMLLIIGSIGYMLYHAATDESTPPDIVVTVDSILPRRSGHLVVFHLTNQGGVTVQELMVEGELLDGSESIETSSMTIHHLPGNSEREAGLFFSRDPHAYTLRIQPKGYERP